MDSSDGLSLKVESEEAKITSKMLVWGRVGGGTVHCDEKIGQVYVWKMWTVWNA